MFVWVNYLLNSGLSVATVIHLLHFGLHSTYSNNPLCTDSTFSNSLSDNFICRKSGFTYSECYSKLITKLIVKCNYFATKLRMG